MANVVDFLMKLDAGKLAEVPTKEVHIKSLSEKTGQDINFKVRALPGRKITEISALSLNRHNDVDINKAYDSSLMLAVEGTVEPDLKDSKLQEHFGAATPKDLAEKLLLGGEVQDIANAVRELSGYSDEDETEDEIKN